MISEAQLRQYANQTGASRTIALQEVALTYVLGAIYAQPWSATLAFKGGTALRKLLFGAQGRFSVDLDFLGARISDDDVLEIAHHLDGLSFHGLVTRIEESRFTTSDPDRFDRPTPPGFSAACTFACELGEGALGLDVSRRRPSFLPLRRVDLVAEGYHRHLEFALPRPLALALEESAAEKVSALARRMQHGAAKDVYDLYLYLDRPFDRPRMRRLVALTLWSDRRVIGDQDAFVARVQPSAFRWEELAQLLPRRGADPQAICGAVRRGLAALLGEMTPDERALVDDAGSHRLVREFGALAERIP